ncbi:MAG TPA: LLM class flavin-dependent oxidoreductase, partial [Actinomycetota bacterium]
MPELRQPHGTAFAVRDPLPWNDVEDIVKAAENVGYAAVFLPEIAGRDALATAGMLAGATRELLLGSGVVPMRSRSLPLTAMSAATVQERSGGRLVLGIGTGGAGRGALAELRATVGGLRALLDGEEVRSDGRRSRLSLVPERRVPIWISALGPRAMRLAGEVADGVILNWCPPERVTFARERIGEGAEVAGRDPESVSVAVYVRAWVGADEPAGLRALNAAAAEYASFPAYARQFEQSGLAEEAAAAASAHRSGRPEDVPERLVRSMAAVGETARETIEAVRAAGAQVPVVYPAAVGDPAPTLEATRTALAPA